MASFVYLEDDAMSRHILELLLTRKLGYTDVKVLADSEGFLEKITALPFKPDVIFVDIHMLPHDGFHILKTIRESGTLPTTRIVALTASVMNEEVETLRRAGFDGVIGKPIDSTTFPDLLNRIIQGERVWRPT